MFKLISIHNLLYIDIWIAILNYCLLKKGYKDFWKKIIKKLHTSLLMCLSLCSEGEFYCPVHAGIIMWRGSSSTEHQR